MLSLCSAWSQLRNLQPLCLTLLRYCDENGWFFPGSPFSPSKITGKSRSSYRAWFWPKVCYSGHTLHSLTPIQLFSLFSCLWSEEALKTWRKGKGTLDGRDLGPEMACKMRPHPKQSVNREHTFIVMNHWSVIENRLTWLIQIYFLSIMKASNDTCWRYCKYQKKRRLYRKSLERQHQSFSSSSE